MASTCWREREIMVGSSHDVYYDIIFIAHPLESRIMWSYVRIYRTMRCARNNVLIAAGESHDANRDSDSHTLYNTIIIIIWNDTKRHLGL